MGLKNTLNLCGAQLTAIVQRIQRVRERLLTARTTIPLMSFAGFTVFMSLRMLTERTFHLQTWLVNSLSLSKPLFLQARPAGSTKRLLNLRSLALMASKLISIVNLREELFNETSNWLRVLPSE